MLKKGFTLIELLIVLAILGVLAVVLFAALDPVEQIAKTRDGGNLNLAKECINAAERYYILHSEDANPNPPNCTCAELVTLEELKGPDTRYADITLVCVDDGVYEATFTPVSTTYTDDICTTTPGTCTVPTDWQ